MPPFKTLEDIRDYAVELHAGLCVRKFAPVPLPPLLHVVRNGVLKNPYRYIERTLRNAAEADKKVFADPAFRPTYAAALLIFNVLLETQAGPQCLPGVIARATKSFGPDSARKVAMTSGSVPARPFLTLRSVRRPFSLNLGGVGRFGRLSRESAGLKDRPSNFSEPGGFVRGVLGSHQIVLA
jgi:hypothetical protein